MEHDRKSLDCFERTVDRNMDIKDAEGEDSEERKESSKESL